MNNTDYHIPVMKHEAVVIYFLIETAYMLMPLRIWWTLKHILEETSSKSKLFAIDKDIDAIEFNKKELSKRRGLPLNMDVSLL